MIIHILQDPTTYPAMPPGTMRLNPFPELSGPEKMLLPCLPLSTETPLVKSSHLSLLPRTLDAHQSLELIFFWKLTHYHPISWPHLSVCFTTFQDFPK